MSLLEKMQKSGSIKYSSILEESVLMNNRDIIPTKYPIINMAFSGKIDGGFTTGLTILAGESKTFKTLLSLVCLKAYQDKYPDSVCLFYDCEFGVTPQYLKSLGLDISRIIHIPIEHVEQLKFDVVKRLEAVQRNDKIFILVDSMGNLASKKEVEDAENEKSVADMTRAKSIRSLLRIITPHLTQKDIPCFMINHIYLEQGLFPKTIIPGGTAVTYAANQIFVITKAQEKEGTEIVGYKFTLNAHKSRFVKEKSKFPFTVDMKRGINKYSGLMELALEMGLVEKRNVGWYAKTGEEKRYRLKNTFNDEFWLSIVTNEKFKVWIENKFQYTMENETDLLVEEDLTPESPDTFEPDHDMSTGKMMEH